MHKTTSLSNTSFFPLFTSSIYRLTSTPHTTKLATLSVLSYFSSQGVAYLELRTTPRHDRSSGMDRKKYVEAVLDAFDEFYDDDQEDEDGKEGMRARLILSVDTRFSEHDALEVVALAREFMHPELSESEDRSREFGKSRRRRRRAWVVGVDLCGPPAVGDPRTFKTAFRLAKDAGLGLTIHFGEVSEKKEKKRTLFIRTHTWIVTHADTRPPSTTRRPPLPKPRQTRPCHHPHARRAQDDHRPQNTHRSVHLEQPCEQDDRQSRGEPARVGVSRSFARIYLRVYILGSTLPSPLLNLVAYFDIYRPTTYWSSEARPQTSTSSHSVQNSSQPRQTWLPC
jgi:hypothetical protein